MVKRAEWLLRVEWSLRMAIWSLPFSGPMKVKVGLLPMKTWALWSLPVVKDR